MKFIFQYKTFDIKRYPPTTNKTLLPWSAADEMMISKVLSEEPSKKRILIINDRFGFHTTVLAEFKPETVVSRKSQEKGISKNLENNNISPVLIKNIPLGEIPEEKADIILIRVPKSLDLFKTYLSVGAKSCHENSQVLCGFMTRHFSKTMLEHADHYFESAEQTRAMKKARLLILKNAKGSAEKPEIYTTELALPDGTSVELAHKPGVFSAGKPDIATQFLLQNLKITESEQKILDVGCGNGIISRFAHHLKPDAEIHAVDDFLPAVESARANLGFENITVHYSDTISTFEKNYFDLIITNPPFHIEHVNTTDVAVHLFKEAAETLSESGRFLCVANRHLNYRTHLVKLFKSVNVLNENERFEIYECRHV